mmetsp:Transcript_34600/g.101493  ORF Transcript_34600/g.101493 Transcript_34600/m.101493 type:complete len:202 (-) Transcript_34600:103-708(-)
MTAHQTGTHRTARSLLAEQRDLRRHKPAADDVRRTRAKEAQRRLVDVDSAQRAVVTQALERPPDERRVEAREGGEERGLADARAGRDEARDGAAQAARVLRVDRAAQLHARLRHIVAARERLGALARRRDVEGAAACALVSAPRVVGRGHELEALREPARAARARHVTDLVADGHRADEAESAHGDQVGARGGGGRQRKLL